MMTESKQRLAKTPAFQTITNIIVDPNTQMKYRIGKFLGKGGFAKVHELTNMHNKVTYAAKIIPKSMMTRKYQIAKVAREITLHRDLNHENVVKLEFFFEDRINAYILLENCPNQSLVHLMKKKSCFSINETRYYVKQLVAGTKYIHSKKIIHRDLKPGNMFLSENMVVKIGDFGLAISAENMSDRVVLCGTPNYIAPEVLCKSRQSYQLDVWAIGCTIYCLMFGIPPYESSSLELTYERIKTNNWDKSKALYHHALLDLLERILVLDPSERLTIDEVEKHIFFDSVADDLSLEHMYLNNSACETADNSSATNPLNAPINGRRNVSQEKSDKLLISKRRTSTIKVTNNNNNNNTTNNKDGWQPAQQQQQQQSRGNALKKLVRSIFRKRKCMSDKSNSSGGGDCCDGARLPQDRVICANATVAPPPPPPGDLCCQLLGKSSNYALLKVVEAICDMKNFLGNDVPKLADYELTFVSKWIDYSNKYGFGYQLTNDTTGVLFNDNSTITVKRNSDNIQYLDSQSNFHTYNLNKMPKALNNKQCYLEFFKEYMDEKLSDGAAVRNDHLKTPLDSYQNPIIKRWVRTNAEIVMELSDGTFQVNFTQDHTKVVLSFRGARADPPSPAADNTVTDLASDVVVTFIDSNKELSHYKAYNLLHYRCPDTLHNRLQYLRCVLNDFVRLDCKV